MRSSKHAEPKAPPIAHKPSLSNTAGLARRASKDQDIPAALRTNAQRKAVEQPRLDGQSGPGAKSSALEPTDLEHDAESDPFLRRGSELLCAAREDGRPPTTRSVPADSDLLRYSLTDKQLEQQLHDHHKPLEGQGYHQSPDDRGLQQRVNISPISQLTGDHQLRNPETASQISYESLLDVREDLQRPVSAQSNGQPSASYTQLQEYPARATPIPPGPRPPPHYTMPRPGSSASPRSGDANQISQAAQGQPPESRDNPPPNYSRGQFGGGQPPTPGMSLVPTGSAAGPGYRGGPPQREYGSMSGEQGRSTPPLVPGERDVAELYKELSGCHLLSHLWRC